MPLKQLRSKGRNTMIQETISVAIADLAKLEIQCIRCSTVVVLDFNSVPLNERTLHQCTVCKLDFADIRDHVDKIRGLYQEFKDSAWKLQFRIVLDKEEENNSTAKASANR